MDIIKLRRETEADHRAVETAFPLLEVGLDPLQYVSCLRRMYGIVASWEERAAEIAPDWMQPMLFARRRRGMLEADLATFGVTELDTERATLPPMDNLPSLLGTMYVMEGSTLGGQILARQAATALHLEEGRGNAYFRGHGERTGAMWKEFCEVLKLRVSEEETEDVVVAAKKMFKKFGEWMQEKSVADET